MKRVGWLVLGMAAVICIALGVTIGRSWYQGPAKAEQQADWVLAEDPAFKKLRAERARVTVAGIAEMRKLRAQSQRWKDSAQALLKEVDTQASAAATTAILPSGITQGDSIVRLSSALQVEQRVAARLRTEVVPMLQRIIRNDSTALWTADATIENQRLALNDEQRRNAQLTKALSDLREQTKKQGKLLGFLPSWTDEVLMVAGATYVGIQIGKGS